MRVFLCACAVFQFLASTFLSSSHIFSVSRFMVFVQLVSSHLLFITAIIIMMFVMVITISLHTILYIMCNCTKGIQKANKTEKKLIHQAHVSFNLSGLLGIGLFGNLKNQYTIPGCFWFYELPAVSTALLRRIAEKPRLAKSWIRLVFYWTTFSRELNIQ